MELHPVDQLFIEYIQKRYGLDEEEAASLLVSNGRFYYHLNFALGLLALEMFMEDSSLWYPDS